MKSTNTGNYRLCRHQPGIGGSIETLSEHNSVDEVSNALNNIKKEDKWVYYSEKEIIYSGTQLDENKNPIDSAPTWIRVDK